MVGFESSSSFFMVENLLGDPATTKPRTHHIVTPHTDLPVSLGTFSVFAASGRSYPATGHDSSLDSLNQSQGRTVTTAVSLSSSYSSLSTTSQRAVDIVSSDKIISIKENDNTYEDAITLASPSAPFLKFGVNAILAGDNNRKFTTNDCGKLLFAEVVVLILKIITDMIVVKRTQIVIR